MQQYGGGEGKYLMSLPILPDCYSFFKAHLSPQLTPPRRCPQFPGHNDPSYCLHHSSVHSSLYQVLVSPLSPVGQGHTGPMCISTLRTMRQAAGEILGFPNFPQNLSLKHCWEKRWGNLREQENSSKLRSTPEVPSKIRLWMGCAGLPLCAAFQRRG